MESIDGTLIDEVSEKNNVNYLQREEHDFEILGELSVYSYDVFSSKEMDELVLELQRLKMMLQNINEINHVNEIILLSNKCKMTPGSRLIFTPF